MRVQFVEKVNGPERLVCDAEILFDEDPLSGMKLVGFSLWRSTDGDVYVTFPSRAFGAGTERKYFDYLRSAEGLSAEVKRVKDWILGGVPRLARGLGVSWRPPGARKARVPASLTRSRSACENHSLGSDHILLTLLLALAVARPLPPIAPPTARRPTCTTASPSRPAWPATWTRRWPSLRKAQRLDPQAGEI